MESSKFAHDPGNSSRRVTEAVQDDAKSSEASSKDDSSELELQIVKIEGRLRSLKERTRPIMAASGAFVTVGILGLILDHYGLTSFNGKTSKLFLTASIGYGVLIPLTTEFMRATRVSRLNQELSLLNARKRVSSQLSVQPDQAPLTYFDRLVTINVENLAAYYELVKDHTEKSFNVAVIAGIVGFMLIVAGLVTSFFQESSSTHAAAISAGSGVITEFISAIFFYLYNRTVASMKGYHDSLLSVQNVLLSFKLVGDTDACGDTKARMVEQMLGYLIGNKVKGEARPSAT
jgi:hypothetical protein